MFLFFIINELASSNYANQTIRNYKKVIRILKEDIKPQECEMKKYDIKSNYYEFGHPYVNEKCKKTFRNKYYKFKDGVLNYKKHLDGIECLYRCNFQQGDQELYTGPWLDITNAKPECDTIEIRCHHVNKKNIVFSDLILQVFKKKHFSKVPPNFLVNSYPINQINNKYNVHIIVLDSISQYNAQRGFPKTIKYLNNYYDAINFKYLNKVGPISLQNAHGFLVNRLAMPLYNFKNLETTQSDYSKMGRNFCNDYLDDQPYIAKYYRKLNYTVMLAEDSKKNVFAWPNCKGFKYNVAHHTARTYVMRLFDSRFNFNGQYLKTFESKCIKNHEYQFKYLSSFMNTYKDTRIFTKTWITHMSHDNLTGHFKYDGYLLEYFKKNKDLFDNGFLIFMADHGFKMGDYRHTDDGNYEDNNPFLFISVPKKLRDKDSEVMENLKYNSEKHVSHFDIYATLFDIATEGSRQDFKNMNPFDLNTIIKNDRIKGLSLLRKIKKKRTCLDMKISSQFCLCREKFYEYNGSTLRKIKNRNNDQPKNDPNVIVNVIKKNFVKVINKILEEGKFMKICAKLTVKKDGLFRMKYMISETNKLIFLVRQEMNPKGIFEAYFNEDGKLDSMLIVRIDKYTPYSEVCLRGDYRRQFCYCKSLFKKGEKGI
uniref:Sulfatase domain-containing protein n=1 Tax=Parastrongyloides trichosuri TaxID=131310 RepID=A0A0N4ZW29_PARTI